jgi:hypothetical protein
MPRFIDDDTAALIGRLLILEEIVADLRERLERQERRGVSPAKLVSEKEAARLLGVGVSTLARWRKSSRPAIPVVEREGIIRYSVADIERFGSAGKRR